MSAALVGFAARGYAFRDAERAAVRPHLLATLGAVMRGARATRTEIAEAALAPARTRLRATVLGRGTAAGPIDAALLDGVAAGGDATLATPVVCAALAAGEAAHLPGAALLDAIVAGLEVALRVRAALAGHTERGWDERGSCGRLGAAVAAARAFGCSRAAVQNAFGLAATAAGGLLAARGTMTEAAIVGCAAADGVEAALLARADFTAAPAALDGRRGLAALMAAGFDANLLVADLGERYLVASFAAAETGVADAVRAEVERLERAPSLAALVAATLA